MVAHQVVLTPHSSRVHRLVLSLGYVIFPRVHVGLLCGFFLQYFPKILLIPKLSLAINKCVLHCDGLVSYPVCIPASPPVFSA